MFNSLIEQMKEREGVTSQLKEENQMEWACLMQNIEARTREIVCNELICSRLIILFINVHLTTFFSV
jgi:hypothetical protein